MKIRVKNQLFFFYYNEEDFKWYLGGEEGLKEIKNEKVILVLEDYRDLFDDKNEIAIDIDQEPILNNYEGE